MPFLNGTPVLEVVLENPFMSRRFPDNGVLLAVFDTGYEGFALIPGDIFESLNLNELSLHRRELILPDGTKVQSTGVYGKVIAQDGFSRDGFIETAEGIDEVVLGTGFATGLKLTLDYCLKRFKIELC
jgi:clan AA aspartic protease